MADARQTDRHAFDLYETLRHGSFLRALAACVEAQIAPRLREIERIVERNQWKVLEAFRACGVSDYHFAPSTGYGLDDRGRDTLEAVYARTFRAEAALVRPQIVSGTHAIALVLFGLLRPGDELVYITGRPYDTLEEVIGVRGERAGSLRDYGVGYRAVPLGPDGWIDEAAVREALSPRTKVVAIQRSCGYDDRPSFSVAAIGEMVRFVKSLRPDVLVFVDNCYGEFTETREPTEVGVDILAGSLIKNPGGGLAKTGGYVVGRAELVEQAAARLTAPGIAREVGATLGATFDFYLGFFLAPHVVGEALKGAVFAAALLERLGFRTRPRWDEPRTDLIQRIVFGAPEPLIAFAQGIQQASPVDAHVVPQPSPMPGYADPVIMAAGTFIQGASMELTFDGPVRPPYVGYLQGGLTYAHVKVGVLTAVDKLLADCFLTPPTEGSNLTLQRENRHNIP